MNMRYTWMGIPIPSSSTFLKHPEQRWSLATILHTEALESKISPAQNVEHILQCAFLCQFWANWKDVCSSHEKLTQAVHLHGTRTMPCKLALNIMHLFRAAIGIAAADTLHQKGQTNSKKEPVHCRLHSRHFCPTCTNLSNSGSAVSYYI